MRDLNLGVHKLGPSGYRVAEPIWDKEDAERAEQGLPPLFDKYRDKQTRNYVRAQYKIDPVTKELTTDPKTKALEKVLVRNTPRVISYIYGCILVNEAKFLNGSHSFRRRLKAVARGHLRAPLSTPL